MDFKEEVRSYQPAFDALKDELADVDFFVDQVVSSPQQVQALAEQLKSADGILVIQVSIGISSILAEILKAARPTIVFAIPYSGHEWAGYGQLQKRPEGELFDASSPPTASNWRWRSGPSGRSITCARPRSST